MTSSDFSEHLRRMDERLRAYRERGLSLFATSSMQTNSVVLLHLLSQVGRDVPVYFINTGYHFAETLAFKRQLAERLGLQILDLASALPKAQQRDAKGRLLFASDPDYCCHLNKVEPLEAVLLEKDVWINGIRASQSLTRRALKEKEPARHGVIRYHPILEWTSEMVSAYIEQHDLPRHPLEEKGYRSVGCQPCTRKPDPEAVYDDRTGRWFGLKKTECGLHTQPLEQAVEPLDRGAGK